MMTNIKFKLGDLDQLRRRLLTDLSKETFALLLGKREKICDMEVIKIVDIRYPEPNQYKERNLTFLNVESNFFLDVLKDLTARYDVDTIIDVHTHPFSKDKVMFSQIDDDDEKTFKRFLNENFDNIHYASIVFSQEEYFARKWEISEKNKIFSNNAMIQTQLLDESIPCSYMPKTNNELNEEMFNRGVLALGLKTLKRITSNQIITIVGAGGTGSVVAESLVHMGFDHINLIDNDKLEISNMNRIVGAYYQDAFEHRYKVDVVSEHLLKINPKLKVYKYKNDVYDDVIEPVLASSSWIIMATDNHSSRFHTQNVAFKYYVPFISLGVNITVEDGVITDESGEIITVRMGDRICLKCLKRINDIKVAQEREDPSSEIAKKLIKRGYVQGADIKEPAVKTLNSIIGQMTVDILVNQYTKRIKHQSIVVYERNITPTIYEDRESVDARYMHCDICSA